MHGTTAFVGTPVMTFDILVVASFRYGSGSSAGYQAAGVIRNMAARPASSARRL